MFYSTVVSIRAMNVRPEHFEAQGDELDAESHGARVTRTLCYLFNELCAMFHVSHIRERNEVAQGPESVDYPRGGAVSLVSTGTFA